MAYRLEDREGMASGIRRIVGEELEKAIEQLEGRRDGDPNEAVHDARKRLKKARSALRLVREDIGNRARRKENAVMRDAARSLSAARDAQVLLETLAGLAADRWGPTLPEEALRSLHRELERRRERLDASLDQDDGPARQDAIRALRAARDRAREWPLEDEGFGAARSGLERIHARGRRAMAAALDEGDDEAWHEWRKRVKDLWYSARILRPIAHPQMDGIVSDADALSDVLGQHQDMAVLDEAIREHRAGMDPGQLQLLHAAVARRRAELRLAALAPARRLYAEKPGAFGRRIAAYWDAQAEEEAARARWLAPEAAARIRELLAAKEAADAAERRRIASELRGLGFRVTDIGKSVPRRSGGFNAEDFDDLVARGLIRVGAPPPVPSG